MTKLLRKETDAIITIESREHWRPAYEIVFGRLEGRVLRTLPGLFANASDPTEWSKMSLLGD